MSQQIRINVIPGMTLSLEGLVAYIAQESSGQQPGIIERQGKMFHSCRKINAELTVAINFHLAIITDHR